jgi:23S rRNA (cytidine1920-2'-O)/16S rRNA (cytidine1409-2'-O)-methyltransferase
MAKAVGKRRLDVMVHERGAARSRSHAQALIMAGKVLVDGETVRKPGQLFPPGARITLKEELPYVSRGGLKLEAALEGFQIDPAGLTVLDAGASTGGFTDCLLQRGAAGVIAVDVGYGQLDWKLRQDPRVHVMERCNLRNLEPSSLPSPIDAAVADLSFISLRLIFPVVRVLIPPSGWFLPMVKPQFEVGRHEVGRGGVVRDSEKIRAAVDGIERTAGEFGFRSHGRLESPVRGPKGNREVFLYLTRESEASDKG